MTFLVDFRGCCGYMEVMHEVIHEVVGLRSSTLQWAPFPAWEITENQDVHQRRNATCLLEVYLANLASGVSWCIPSLHVFAIARFFQSSMTKGSFGQEQSALFAGKPKETPCEADDQFLGQP